MFLKLFYGLLSVLIGVGLAYIALIFIKKNKNLYAKLSKHFHMDGIIYLIGFLISIPIKDYLIRDEPLQYSFVVLAIWIIIVLVVDFLIKKYWK